MDPAPPPLSCFPRSSELRTRLGPQMAQEMNRLEGALRCRVCLNLFEDPVMAARCQHNFCSLCIRSYLNYKQQCPECFRDLHETDLRPNRALKEVVAVLAEGIFPSLWKSLEEGRGRQQQSGSKSDRRTVRTPSELTRTDAVIPRKSLSDGDDDSSFVASAASAASAPTRCPVCSVEVPKRNADRHVQRCLKESSNPVPSSVGTPNGMKPVRKPVYHLLKEVDLRRLVRESGLDWRGNRAALVRRHQRFAAAWNTQCDRERPLSRMEVLMQVKREEQEERKAAATTSKSQLLDYDRRTDVRVIETKKKEYLKENKSRFDRLIKDVRDRRQQRDVEKEEQEEATRVGESEEEEEDDDEITVLEERLSSPPPPPPHGNSDKTNRSVSVKSSSSEDLFGTPKHDVKAPCEEDAGGGKGGGETKRNFFSPQKKHATRASESESSNQVETPKKADRVGKASEDTPEKGSRLASDRDRRLSSTPSIREALETSSKLARRARKASCPVCQQAVPQAHINAHLDRCLRVADQEDSKDKIQGKRKLPAAAGGKLFRRATGKDTPTSSTTTTTDDEEDDDITDIDNILKAEDAIAEREAEEATTRRKRRKVAPSSPWSQLDPAELVEAVYSSEKENSEISEKKEEEEEETLSQRLRRKGKSLPNGKVVSKKCSKRLAERAVL